MPDIGLLIPDPALCSAVTEQLQLTPLGDVRMVKDATSALACDVALIDGSLCDKKLFKLLRETQNEKMKRVFIIGDAAEAEENENAETIVKPVRLGHLMARLQFFLQASARRKGPVQFGPYLFEAQNRRVVTKVGDAVRLTEKETALLDYLAQSDRPVPREELLASIWGYDARIDTHTLETHIYRLRRKLDPDGSGTDWLTNEEGGYRLRKENTA